MHKINWIFEDFQDYNLVPINESKPCTSPSHNPPMLLYIPPGQKHHHVCPSCGAGCILHGSSITF